YNDDRQKERYEERDQMQDKSCHVSRHIMRKVLDAQFIVYRTVIICQKLIFQETRERRFLNLPDLDIFRYLTDHIEDIIHRDPEKIPIQFVQILKLILRQICKRRTFHIILGKLFFSYVRYER